MADPVQPDTQTAPAAGDATAVGPGIVRVLAPNPSPMTHWGTNTYILGQDQLIVIDPGPALADHLAALMRAIEGRPVSHIVVTHAHGDHSALAPDLARATDAPVLAFGPATAGRSAVMFDLAKAGLADGGEGIDHRFTPDHRIGDGDQIDNGEVRLTALHTPGHLGNHICLRGAGHYFTGDHLMSWAPSLVSPPDGDLTDFMASCARLRSLARPGDVSHPGHGAPVVDTSVRLDALIAHRTGREAQILAALAVASGTSAALAARIYTDVPRQLLPAAARNVLAHLIDLTGRNLARPHGAITAEAVFSAI